MRGAAAQAVVVGHSIAFLGLWGRLATTGPFMQNMAVVVFFVLSGLLITHTTRLKLADTRKGYRSSDYFIDRFSRIYTAFLPALIAILLIDLITRAIHPDAVSLYQDATDVPTFLGNVFMLQDFPAQGRLTGALGIDPVTSFGSARPLWTVAIEWWIYLAVGWLLFLWLRAKANSGRLRLLIWAIPLIPLAIVPLRNFVNVPLGGPGRGNGLFLMWLMGAAVSFAWPAMARSRISSTIWLLLGSAFAVGAIAGLFITNIDAYRLEFAAAIALALACGIAGLDGGLARTESEPAKRGADPSLMGKIAKFVADYSFSLYLLHYTVIVFLFSWAKPNLTWLIIMFLVANVVSIAFAWAFEARYPKVRRWLRDALDQRGPTLTQVSRADQQPGEETVGGLRNP